MRGLTLLRSLFVAAIGACGARTGLDSSRGITAPAPGTVITGLLAISAGRDHTCALRSDGTVVCWGADDLGQLGNGTTNALTNDPVQVSGLTDAVAISAGPDFTCAVRSGGTIVCWGSNGLGDLTQEPAPSPLPAAVVGVPDAKSVATALESTCELASGGAVTCWVGLSGTVTATPVPELNGSLAIANGFDQCGLLPGGRVMCTGAALGYPNTPIAGGATAMTVASTGDVPVGCALLAGGSVSCWPLDAFGGQQVGVPIAGLAAASAVATSGAHTCAVLADTTVACWGSNAFGQLGDGTGGDSATPVHVANLSGATAIATGWYHTCALLADRTGACWGNNQLRTRDGGVTNAMTPVTVTF